MENRMLPYTQLCRTDLYSLEKYAQIRKDFRQEVMAHKANRRLAIGPNVMLYFENNLTMQYQIQEMLHAERIFELNGIEEELGAYNPLIPSGNNLKATMMVQFVEVDERVSALQRLKGIEDKIWLCVDGHEPVYPISDEDMERENDIKTSAVHFQRFEFNDDMIRDLKMGNHLSAGCDHKEYTVKIDPVDQWIVNALIKDFK